MAAPSKKPASKGTKGTPPKAADTHVVGNNTSKPAPGEKVPLNFRVEPEFRKRLRLFSTEHEIDMVDIMIEAVSEYLDRKGG